MHWNWRCELTPGLALSGETAQMLCLYDPAMGKGIVQTDVWVRAGETLELELWALAQSQPTKLEIILRPRVPKLPPYAATELLIDKPYWSRYTVTLPCPADDDHAELALKMRSLTLVWLDQIHLRPAGEFLRRDAIEAMKQLRPTVLRYPGGCECTSFRWRHSVGPAHRRPHVHDPVFKRHINYDFGTDEFLSICSELSATPHLSVTIGNGTPDDAADWADHCRQWYERQGLKPPMVYFHLGNEHMGAWELGHMEGKTYAQVLRDFVPGIRAAYPNSRIIALGHEHAWVAGKQHPWREVILREAAEYFDVLGLQLYGAADPSATVFGAKVDPTKLMQSIIENLRHRMAPMLRQAADDAAAAGKSIAITEWNLWTHLRQYHEAGRFEEPGDGAHLLFVSLFQHALWSLGPALELVNYYALLNPMGLVQSRRGRVWFNPLAELFKLWRDAIPGTWLPLQGGDEAVNVVAVRGESKRWLFAVNPDMQAPCELRWDSLGLGRELRSVTADDADDLARTQPPVALRGSKAMLPPLSFNRIELES
jgi:hypothetical protein